MLREHTVVVGDMREGKRPSFGPWQQQQQQRWFGSSRKKNEQTFLKNKRRFESRHGPWSNGNGRRSSARHKCINSLRCTVGGRITINFTKHDNNNNNIITRGRNIRACTLMVRRRGGNARDVKMKTK
jgi:hypothetical protein